MIKHAIKCKKCGNTRQPYHDAEFYNSFKKHFCSSCGADSGCWVDIKLRLTSISKWWNPATWFRYSKEEL